MKRQVKLTFYAQLDFAHLGETNEEFKEWLLGEGWEELWRRVQGGIPYQFEIDSIEEV